MPAAAALSVHQRKQRKKAKSKARAQAASVSSPSASASARLLWLRSLPASAGVLSPDVLSDAFVSAARSRWSAAAASGPFPHVTLGGSADGGCGLLSAEFAAALLADCRERLSFTRRETDLYSLHQSQDLKAVEERAAPAVHLLVQELYSARFRQLVAQVSGLQLSALSSSVSISCAVYGAGDRLLCHDDRLQGRRIAYILYLVPQDWAERDGGQLDLFASAEGLQPSAPVHSPRTVSLVPAFNTLSFFAVRPDSHHSVREVTAAAPGRLRVAISGWFHGPDEDGQETSSGSAAEQQQQQQQQPAVVCPPLLQLPCESLMPPPRPASASASAVLSYWLAAEYLRPAVCRSACARFQQDSAIQLTGLLRPERYDQLMAELLSLQPPQQHTQWIGGLRLTVDDSSSGGERMADERRWLRCGPLNQANYGRFAFHAPGSERSADSSGESTAALQAFSLFVRSPVFASWLSRVTGLASSFTGCSGEWRRFGCGDYSLAHDGDGEQREEACDLNFCFLPLTAARSRRDWKDDWGGALHYIAAGVEEPLLCSPPAANTATVVYRAGCSSQAAGEQEGEEGEEGGSSSAAVMRFVSYVSHRAPCPRYDCDLVFRPAASDDGRQG